MRRLGDLLAATYPGRVFVLPLARASAGAHVRGDLAADLARLDAWLGRRPGGAGARRRAASRRRRRRRERRAPQADPARRLPCAAPARRCVRGRRAAHRQLPACASSRDSAPSISGLESCTSPDRWKPLAGGRSGAAATPTATRPTGSGYSRPSPGRSSDLGMCPRRSTAERRDHLARRLDESRPSSVIYARQSFCDPGAYDAVLVAELAEERGLPFLEIEVGFPFEAGGPLHTRVEAFLEAQLLDDDLLDDLRLTTCWTTSRRTRSDLDARHGRRHRQLAQRFPHPHRLPRLDARRRPCRAARPRLPARCTRWPASLELFKPGAIVPWVSYLFPTEILSSYGITPMIPEIGSATITGSDLRDAAGSGGRPHGPRPRRLQLPPHRSRRGGERHAPGPHHVPGDHSPLPGQGDAPGDARHPARCALPRDPRASASGRGSSLRPRSWPTWPSRSACCTTTSAAGPAARPTSRRPWSFPTGPRRPGARSCTPAWPATWRWTAARPSPSCSWASSSGAPQEGAKDFERLLTERGRRDLMAPGPPAGAQAQEASVAAHRPPSRQGDLRPLESAGRDGDLRRDGPDALTTSSTRTIPFPGLARRLTDHSLWGTSARRARLNVALAKRLKVDGVVHFNHWGCRHGLGSVPVVRVGLHGSGHPVPGHRRRRPGPRRAQPGEVAAADGELPGTAVAGRQARYAAWTKPHGRPKKLAQDRFGKYAASYVDSRHHAGGPDLERLVELAGDHPLLGGTRYRHRRRSHRPSRSRLTSPGWWRPISRSPCWKRLGSSSSDAAPPTWISRVADAEDLPFAANSFDLVTCRIAAHHFPRPRPLRGRRCVRVLRPGGLFLLQDQVTPEDRETAAWLTRVREAKGPQPLPGALASRMAGAPRRFRAGQVETEDRFEKRLNLVKWVGAQEGTAEDLAELRARLRQAPPAVDAWMRPTDLDRRRGRIHHRPLRLQRPKVGTGGPGRGLLRGDPRSAGAATRL